MTAREQEKHALNIPDEEWLEVGHEPERWARIIYDGSLEINGTSFHLEGWAVRNERGFVQTAVHGDEALGAIAHSLGADGPFQTITVRRRKYIIIASPFCD